MREDIDITKFFWTVLKHLDTKSIKWDQIASELQISNGHAARMRYSRYKAQMEGRKPVPRGPRVKSQSGASGAPRSAGAGGAAVAAALDAAIGAGGGGAPQGATTTTTTAASPAAPHGKPSRKRKAVESLEREDRPRVDIQEGNDSEQQTFKEEREPGPGPGLVPRYGGSMMMGAGYELDGRLAGYAGGDGREEYGVGAGGGVGAGAAARRGEQGLGGRLERVALEPV